MLFRSADDADVDDHGRVELCGFCERPADYALSLPAEMSAERRAQLHALLSAEDKQLVGPFSLRRRASAAYNRYAHSSCALWAPCVTLEVSGQTSVLNEQSVECELGRCRLLVRLRLLVLFVASLSILINRSRASCAASAGRSTGARSRRAGAAFTCRARSRRAARLSANRHSAWGAARTPIRLTKP